ncbi:14-3-3 protein [Sanghuangporus baumii]|uniref:14-3-3 protein n=1 Tax=Sanghuangporus baumii TaxID=108892 RepID=A0A9Q5N391_SANBA|nr:14-3-3 protein [Sanghuangporus baumii]
MAAKSREECLYLAKVAEAVDRYSEMLEFVKAIVFKFSHGQLTPEERSLLSVAYKNVTGQLRSSWRSIAHIEEVESPKSTTTQRERELIRQERTRIEREIVKACEDVLQIVSTTLIPAANPGDEIVFYHKMKGDYYRYLAELSRGDKRKDHAAASLDAYKVAYKLALGSLEATHPTRLGLALNFAVYYRDVLNSPERACHLAKHAFDEAVAVLDQMQETTFRDSLLILQLLRDDMTLWYKEIQERDEQEAKVQEQMAA